MQTERSRQSHCKRQARIRFATFSYLSLDCDDPVRRENGLASRAVPAERHGLMLDLRGSGLEWTRAEIQRLHHVIGSLRKWHCVVDRQRAEWRDPGKTNAGRRAHDVVVGNLRGLRTEHGRPGV